MQGTVRIELRKGVAGKNGMIPLSLIYSLGGIRKRYALKKLVFEEYWNSKDQRAFYIPVREAKKLLPSLADHFLLSDVEIKEINKEIEKSIAKIESVEGKFIANKIPFSSEMVIEELKEIDADNPKTKIEEPREFLFEFMDQYIKDHETTREKGSLTVYKSVKNHLQAYQKAEKQKVSFEAINTVFFQKFQRFLIKRTKTDKEGNVSPMLNNTTIAKALSTLKTFLNYAREQGVKVNDSYRSFKIRKEKLEVIALEQSELDSILNLDLSKDKRLSKTRDLFVFSCATGLRYSDIAQLKREHIGNDAITLIVKKTKTELTIPLNSISASILDKYRDLHKPLPLISNQNLNYYIKDLCKAADIDKPVEIIRFNGTKRIVNLHPKYELIHFHTGRKTFVTLSLEKGMSAEEVMEITGHTDYKSFKRYVNITGKRKIVVMHKAWGEPEAKLKVV